MHRYKRFIQTKRYPLKKTLRAVGGLSFALTCCIPALTFFMVHRYTGRPRYSAERKKQHEANYQRLITEFHAQPVSFTTSDQLRLAGFLIIRAHAQRVLLICHGYRMCKERMIRFAEMFPHDTILLFDYRAHGQSEGKRTTIGFLEREDVQAALKFIMQDPRTNNLPVIGIGVSMGAVSLLGATAQEPHVKALILDSPFAQLDRQARKAFTYKYYISVYPFASLAQKIYCYLLTCSLDQVNALDWAHNIKIPTLIIHSDQDKVVPIDDARLLFDNLACQEKAFWCVSRSGHAKIFDEVPEYAMCIEHFLERIVL